MRRVLSVIVGILAVCVLVPSAVFASAYGQGGVPTVQSSSAAPLLGGFIQLSASGFCATTPVTFAIAGTTVGTATTSATGSASVSVTVPATAGTYSVTATSVGAGCALVASSSITVHQLGDGALPVTGSTGTTPTLQIGAISVLVGLGLFTAVKIRRRRPQISAS